MARNIGTVAAGRAGMLIAGTVALGGIVAAAIWAGSGSAPAPQPAAPPVPPTPQPSGLLSGRAEAPARFGRLVGQPDPSRFAPLGAPGKLDARVVQSAPEPGRKPGETLELEPPYDILGAATLGSGSLTITLADVEGPDREAICFDKDQLLFACGLAARAALSNTLSRRPLTCQVRQALGGESYMAACRTEEGDLAKLLTRQGWLRPITNQDRELNEAASLAEAAGVGMWNGGWRIRASFERAPPPPAATATPP